MALVDYRKLVLKRASHLLAPSESVRCAFLCKPHHVMRKAAFDSAFDSVFGALLPIGGATGGAITGVASSALDLTVDKLRAEPPNTYLASTFPAGEDVILAITTARCLVFRQKFGLASPNLVVAAAYAPADIARLAIGRGAAMRRLMLIFADESALQLSLPRGQGDVSELVAGFQSFSTEPSA